MAEQHLQGLHTQEPNERETLSEQGSVLTLSLSLSLSLYSCKGQTHRNQVMSLGLCSDTFAFCEFICDSINRARARQIIHYKIALYICKRAIYICKIYRVFVTHGRRTNPKHRDNTTHARFGSHFLGSHVAHTHTHTNFLSVSSFLSLSLSLARRRARALSPWVSCRTLPTFTRHVVAQCRKNNKENRKERGKKENRVRAQVHIDARRHLLLSILMYRSIYVCMCM